MQGPRSIVRELTHTERATLQRRQYALQCGLLAFQGQERDQVRGALHAMLGGFRSLRERDDNAETSVEVLLAVLRDFPAWAVEEACLRIAQQRTEIDPPLDPRWPPNDGQVHALVAAVVAPYRQNLTTASALLAAPVEQPAPPPVPPQHDWHIWFWRMNNNRGDGQHAARVAEELAARKARRERAA
jgi:hypothetical protein